MTQQEIDERMNKIGEEIDEEIKKMKKKLFVQIILIVIKGLILFGGISLIVHIMESGWWITWMSNILISDSYRRVIKCLRVVL